MGMRFRKSKSLGGGLKLNIGKNGVGLSAGIKGARMSINSSGRKTTTVGIPGSGLSYTKSSGGQKNVRANESSLGGPAKVKTGQNVSSIKSESVLILILGVVFCIASLRGGLSLFSYPGYSRFVMFGFSAIFLVFVVSEAYSFAKSNQAELSMLVSNAAEMSAPATAEAAIALSESVLPSFQEPVSVTKVSTKSTRSFPMKVVGVTFDNDDGTSRQDIISGLDEGDEIELEPYEYNGESAVYVLAGGDIIGNVPKKNAKEISDRIDNGEIIGASIKKISSDEDGENHGVTIEINVMEPVR